MKALKFLKAMVVAVAVMGCAVAQADREWNYLYRSSTRGAVYNGYLSLSDVSVDGNAKARLVTGGPGIDFCMGGGAPAVVTETDAEIVITVKPIMNDCRFQRFTIKKDGTGGYLEVMENSSEWVRRTRDYGLTSRG